MLSMNGKKLYDKIIWYDYVKPIEILEKYANNIIIRIKL